MWPEERKTLQQLYPELASKILQLWREDRQCSDWYYDTGLGRSMSEIDDQTIRDYSGVIGSVIFNLYWHEESGETDTTDLREQVSDAHRMLLWKINILRKSDHTTKEQLELLQTFEEINTRLVTHLYSFLHYLETDPEYEWLRLEV